MTTVIVSRTTVKTDAFAGLSLDSVTYSTVTLSWTNVSSGVATFRIVGKSTYEDVVVPGGEKRYLYSNWTNAQEYSKFFT